MDKKEVEVVEEEVEVVEEEVEEEVESGLLRS